MIRLERLSGLRGDRLLFEGVNCRLGAGEAAVVTGRNGAGKSSLLRICAGLLRPAAGVVARAGAVALDTERSALDDDLSLAAALRFWARLDGAGAEAQTAALDRFDLADLADVPVRLLSTGQRRRAGLARVTASGAPIWLLDEPANGLDARSVERLHAAIAAHRVAGGVAMVAAHGPFQLPDAREIRL